MTKNGEITKKKPGTGLTSAGLFIAGIGLFLVLISVFSGGAGAPLTWLMVGLGLILAAIGFAQRMLAAAESR